MPDRNALAMARSDVRALALRADDFRELCDDDVELGETLLETVGALLASASRRPGRITRVGSRADTEAERAPSNSDVIEPPPPVMAPLPISARSSSTAQDKAQDKAQGRPGPRPPTPPSGTPRAATPPSGTPSRPPPQPAPTRPSKPGMPAADPRTPLPPRVPPTRVTPSGMAAAREPGPSDTETDVLAEDITEISVEGGSGPVSRGRRAPSEPEIETFYEAVDVEAPALPAPPAPPGPGDTVDLSADEDEFAEMTVSIESIDEGSGRVERVTDSHDSTMTLTLDEDIDGETVAEIRDDMAEEEPTRANVSTADDAAAASSASATPDHGRKKS